MEIIRGHRINKIYKTGTTENIAVKDVSISIKKGETLAIIGPSGCGKTTLLMILGGIVKPTSGKVYIHDEEIWNLNERKRAQVRKNMVSYIMQNSFLINEETIKYNLEIPLLLKKPYITKKMRKEKIDKVLQLVGLYGREKELAGNLSGGEQQRIAIARALLQDSEVIFADEPTGALDSQAGEEFFCLLHRLVKEYNKSLVLVTHNIALANKCDVIYKMYDGMILE